MLEAQRLLHKQCQMKLDIVCLSIAYGGVFGYDQFNLIFSRRYRIDYLCVNTHKGIKITNVFVDFVVVCSYDYIGCYVNFGEFGLCK